MCVRELASLVRGNTVERGSRPRPTQQEQKVKEGDVSTQTFFVCVGRRARAILAQAAQSSLPSAPGVASTSHSHIQRRHTHRERKMTSAPPPPPAPVPADAEAGQAFAYREVSLCVLLPAFALQRRTPGERG